VVVSHEQQRTRAVQKTTNRVGFKHRAGLINDHEPAKRATKPCDNELERSSGGKGVLKAHRGGDRCFFVIIVLVLKVRLQSSNNLRKHVLV
jgi:hypothetical protein